MTGAIELQPEFEIVIRRTITLTVVIPFLPGENYTGEITSPELAAEYERNQEFGEKIESFTEELAYSEESEIDFSETITVQKVEKKE